LKAREFRLRDTKVWLLVWCTQEETYDWYSGTNSAVGKRRTA
jgi:hypothetical protein